MKYAILLLMILAGAHIHAKSSGSSGGSSSGGGSKSSSSSGSGSSSKSGSSSSSASYDPSTGTWGGSGSLSNYNGWNDFDAQFGTCNGTTCLGSGDSSPPPVACPKSYTAEKICNVSVSQIPTTIVCGSYSQTFTEIPLRSPACTFSEGGAQISATGTCKGSETLSCDPCVARNCPAGVN